MRAADGRPGGRPCESAPDRLETLHGTNSARGKRRDRRLQGPRAGAPGHGRGPRRAGDPDARQQALRGGRLLRGAERGARAEQRVRARPCGRCFSRRTAAGPRAPQPPRAGGPSGRVRGRAGLGQHDRQAGPRARGQPALQLRPRRAVPARAGAGDERPHVRAPGHAGQPRAAPPARGPRDPADRRTPRLPGGARLGQAGRAGRDPRGARAADRGEPRERRPGRRRTLELASRTFARVP